MAGLKKIVAGIFLLLAVFVAGCGRSALSAKQDNKGSQVKILSTIAQIGDLVSEIGGSRVESRVLVRGELCPHSYELVKGDDEKIQGADLVFYNGLGLEHGASVASMVHSHPRSFAIGDAIRQQHPEKILWKGTVPDPHIWMDISLWKEAVDLIADRLVEIDPSAAIEYRLGADRLKEKMLKMDEAVREQLSQIPPERRYLVTSHDAFHYFARRYLAENDELNWEKRFQAPEGLSPDAQLNPVDLRRIVDHLHKYRIETLFPESNVSRDSIRKLMDAGKKMGLQLRICKEVLYGDSFRGSYLDAMKHNAAVIAEGLGK